MRLRFVLALLVLVLAVSGTAFFLNRILTRPLAGPQPPAGAAAVLVAASKTDPVSLPSAVPVPGATTASTLEQRQAARDAEVDHLQDLSMNDDAASLSTILNDLTNSEKDIRRAAIEAAKQFGSPEAIPALKAAAASAPDTGEKMELLAAVDFLSLPTIADREVQRPGTPEQIQAATQKQTPAQSLNPKENAQSTPP